MDHGYPYLTIMYHEFYTDFLAHNFDIHLFSQGYNSTYYNSADKTILTFAKLILLEPTFPGHAVCVIHQKT